LLRHLGALLEPVRERRVPVPLAALHPGSVRPERVQLLRRVEAKGHRVVVMPPGWLPCLRKKLAVSV
jgi:hypothetical protein